MHSESWLRLATDLEVFQHLIILVLVFLLHTENLWLADSLIRPLLTQCEALTHAFHVEWAQRRGIRTCLALRACLLWLLGPGTPLTSSSAASVAQGCCLCDCRDLSGWHATQCLSKCLICCYAELLERCRDVSRNRCCDPRGQVTGENPSLDLLYDYATCPAPLWM